MRVLNYISEIILIAAISYISLKNDKEEDEYSLGTVNEVKTSLAYNNNASATHRMKQRLISMSGAHPIGMG